MKFNHFIIIPTLFISSLHTMEKNTEESIKVSKDAPLSPKSEKIKKLEEKIETIEADLNQFIECYFEEQRLLVTTLAAMAIQINPRSEKENEAFLEKFQNLLMTEKEKE